MLREDVQPAEVAIDVNLDYGAFLSNVIGSTLQFDPQIGGAPVEVIDNPLLMPMDRVS